MTIPIMRPLLPTADKLLPYLKSIDVSRWYSNNGSLNQEYEERLSKRFNCYVVTCSSATSGLTAALMAILPFNYKTRAMVGMPSWTYSATASAIFAAGFRPLICDVDENNVLDISCAGGCRAFVPVMPLGASIDLERWNRLAVPVVVDGAAGFDVLSNHIQSGKRIGAAPIVVSTHSTKVLSTAEGGFVLSDDKALIDKIRIILNQGMLPDKNIDRLGFNGKLSEYHAAIGLAELDSWQEKRAKWLLVHKYYGEQMEYVTSTHEELLPEWADINAIVKEMDKRGIMCRSTWYGICHEQDVFMKAWCDEMGCDGKINMPMERTKMLRKQTIFLPKFVDMAEDQIEYIKLSLDSILYEMGKNYKIRME